LQIEECIEEEVMYDSAGEEEEEEGEEEEGRSSDGMATNSSELDFYLSGLSFIKHQRVPFPELGVDIVDGVCSGAVLNSELKPYFKNAVFGDVALCGSC
jgi:hypothetical protein